MLNCQHDGLKSWRSIA